MKKAKNFRNVFLRVFVKNKLKKDNDKLGLKSGDDYVMTPEEFVENIETLAKRKKGLEYYAIIHNKGTSTEHMHCVICCGKTSQITDFTLRNMFPYSDIEGVKYGVRNTIQYLVHMNDPDKPQYSWDDVITNCPEKLPYYKKPSDEATKFEIEKIISDITNGVIKECDIHKKIDQNIYIRYRQRISAAFDFQRRVDSSKVDRNMQVFVFYGETGVGKTSLAKAFAKKENLSISFSSSSNDILENYRGEDIFVIDDYDCDRFGIGDFLKLLDPNTATTAKSRYHNKVIQAKYLIIATNIDINNWYIFEKDILRKAMFRRIKYVFNFQGVSDDLITEYTINKLVPSGIKEAPLDKYNNVHEIELMNLVNINNEIYTFNLKEYITEVNKENNNNDDDEHFINEITKL
ncbi:MAG: hypothetical protein K6B15_02665 [Parasporobacterium sp.]|nr:hypothetical protein [Parasporobacterium sp.]